MRIDTGKVLKSTQTIMQEYGEGKLDALFSSIDEHTVFIGPREGQILRSAAEIRNAWITKVHMPDFETRDLTMSLLPVSASQANVVAAYTVIYHREDGQDLVHPQVLLAGWTLRAGGIVLSVLMISNPAGLDERDLKYNSFGDTASRAFARRSPSALMVEKAPAWVLIPGPYHSLDRYPLASIVWIETAQEGHRSLVHARDTDIPSSRPLSYFLSTCPGCFLRPSVSCLVNPAYVRTLRKQELTLWNGETIYIPARRYTSFRKEVEDRKG